jgi:hypothetical protein
MGSKRQRDYLFYRGTKRYRFGKIEVVPFEAGLRALGATLAGGPHEETVKNK